MRVAIADNNTLKFTEDLKLHWEQKHEVKYEIGASPALAQWADIYYIDTWDNNLHYLYDLYHDDPREQRTHDWDNDKKPMIVCRALDWEVWLGHARDQKVIDWVDKVICIAPHIEKELRAHGNFRDKLKCIRPGVNLNKFTLKQKQTDGWQLGMVLGDMWKYKNHMGGLDIFTALYRQDPRWRLHIRGQHENQAYDPINFEYYLESRGIKDVVTLYESVPDINLWLENIDILLHPGQKEAFCYAVAEAMAKGIPVVVNDFYGSKDIWSDYCYQTHEEAIERINSIINPKYGSVPTRHRQFIQDNYSLERQLKETDEYLGTS